MADFVPSCAFHFARNCSSYDLRLSNGLFSGQQGDELLLREGGLGIAFQRLDGVEEGIFVTAHAVESLDVVEFGLILVKL